MADLQNKVVSRITLYADASASNKPAFIYAKQYDVNSRYIVATIMTATGQIAPSGIVQLNATKPDGTVCYSAGLINPDNTVTFELHPQFLSVTGEVSCDISIISADDSTEILLTTPTFFIIVEESNYNSDAIESDDSYTIIPDVLETMAEYSDAAREAANDSAESALAAEQAKQVAEFQRIVSARVVDDELIITYADDAEVNAGVVRGRAFEYEDFTEEQLEALRGPAGADGAPGKDGKDGINGRDGQDGYTPQKGVDYFDGKDGKDGIDGAAGTRFIAQAEKPTETDVLWLDTDDDSEGDMDLESLALLIETDMLPAVHDENGKILTDENGKIILRY